MSARKERKRLLHEKIRMHRVVMRGCLDELTDAGNLWGAAVGSVSVRSKKPRRTWKQLLAESAVAVIPMVAETLSAKAGERCAGDAPEPSGNGAAVQPKPEGREREVVQRY